MELDPTDSCWTLLRAASAGDPEARSKFARSYAGTIRAAFEARWRGGALGAETEDALQDVFVECFKPGGALERAKPERGEFRALLFGVVQNVARRIEERGRRHRGAQPGEPGWEERVSSGESSLATAFDRGWARSLVREASELHRARAAEGGASGLRRLELLERRFRDDEAIRAIAADWGVPAQDVHNEYRKARLEFYRCLRDVVSFHAPAGADLDQECRRVLASLG